MELVYFRACVCAWCSVLNLSSPTIPSFRWSDDFWWILLSVVRVFPHLLTYTAHLTLFCYSSSSSSFNHFCFLFSLFFFILFYFFYLLFVSLCVFVVVVVTFTFYMCVKKFFMKPIAKHTVHAIGEKRTARLENIKQQFAKYSFSLCFTVPATENAPPESFRCWLVLPFNINNNFQSFFFFFEKCFFFFENLVIAFHRRLKHKFSTKVF